MNNNDRFIPPAMRTNRKVGISKFPATDKFPARTIGHISQQITIRTLDKGVHTDDIDGDERADCGCPYDSVKDIYRDLLTGCLICKKCISQCSVCRFRVAMFNIEEHEGNSVCKLCLYKLKTPKLLRYFQT